MGPGGQQRFVVFSWEAPRIAPTSAGGEYLLSYLRTLVTLGDVVVVYPVSQNGDLQPGELLAGVRSIAVSLPERVLSFPGGTALEKVGAAIVGMSWGPLNGLSLRRSSEVRRAVQEADVVEFHWTLSAGYRHLVRKWNPSARQVVICYDIYSQLWERRTQQSTGLRRIYSWLRRVRCESSERAVFSRMDNIVVLSEKDESLVLGLAPNSRVDVCKPPLGFGADEQRVSQIAERSPIVLFTGLLSDRKNDDAARLLVQRIWPIVKRDCPEARLVIAGAGPSSLLLEASLADQSIEVTGAVEDLSVFYGMARIFVAPLRLGSGVKFKVLYAMAAGTAVVASPVAAEGIGDPKHYVAVSEDCNELATRTISVLQAPEQFEELVRMSRAWVLAEYGVSGFEASLRALHANRGVKIGMK